MFPWKTVIFAFSVALCSARVSYDGFQVWRIRGESLSSLERLRIFQRESDLDVFGASKFSADVLVEPTKTRELMKRISQEELLLEVLVSDLGKLLRDEEKRILAKPAEFSLSDYNTYEEIEEYLKNLNETNSMTYLSSLGKSVEGRDLWQLRISVGEPGERPAMWVDCNIHAREWITAATCLYGINLLTSSYGSDPEVTSLMDKYDVYILPIVNPDGYSFTWTNDRLWRKNRNKYPEDACFGIDLNRNFDDHFGGEGTSNISCSQTYRGPFPASEPEIQVVQNGIQDLINKEGLQVLYSIHSYSQLWMYPFAYTESEDPPEADELDALCQIGAEALRMVNGTEYECGPWSTTLYISSGTTIDYAYSHGITYSFTLELRDEGKYGFLLPAEQITPTGKETWAGLIASTLAV